MSETVRLLRISSCFLALLLSCSSAMLYLLYGADTYRRKERLREFRAAYRARNPEALGETVISGAEPLVVLRDAFASGGGLFERKRLLVVRGAFSAHGDALLRCLDEMRLSDRNDLNIVFVEDEASGEAWEAFRTRCRAEEFRRLPAAKVRKWLSAYAGSRGPKEGPRVIADDAIETLLRLCWSRDDRGKPMFVPDLWRLASELEKILAYAAGRSRVTVADVRAVVRFRVEQDIFPVSDGVCGKEPLSALVAASRLTAEGEEADGLIGYAIRETRNLVRAKAALDAGKTAGGDKAFGVNPYVWKKRAAQAHSWSTEEAQSLLGRALALEIAWKTGGDKRLALDRFILQA